MARKYRKNNRIKGNSERDLRKICKGASFGYGIAVHGADAAKAESAVADWAKKNVE